MYMSMSNAEFHWNYENEPATFTVVCDCLALVTLCYIILAAAYVGHKLAHDSYPND